MRFLIRTAVETGGDDSVVRQEDLEITSGSERIAHEWARRIAEGWTEHDPRIHPSVRTVTIKEDE